MLKTVLTHKLPSLNERVVLSFKESYHVIKVLRLKTGAIIRATVIDVSQRDVLKKDERYKNVQSAFVRLVIDSLKEGGNKKFQAYIEWIDPLELGQDAIWVEKKIHRSFEVFLGLCVLRPALMASTIQKACELQVDGIFPIKAKYSVYAPEEKIIQRWQDIADQSLKQSRRQKRMLIHPVQSFDNFIEKIARLKKNPDFLDTFSQIIWCDESLVTAKDSQENRSLFHVLNTWHKNKCVQEEKLPQFFVIIGPEGGFDAAEKKALSHFNAGVSLGDIILKADTAAVFAISCINCMIGQKN